MAKPIEGCHIGVTRNGEDEPCDKPAIGLIIPSDWELEEFGPDLPPYPCCANHARVGRMVTLNNLADYLPYGRLR